MSSSEITLRQAGPQDLEAVRSLILELAEYEKLCHECTGTAGELHAALFGPKPLAEAILAFAGDRPAGVAIFFLTFSTFACRPILYLEDFFVRPEFRRMGVGRRLFERLAELASERGCKSIEFSVLHWNEPAMEFYRSAGATPDREWVKFRMGSSQISALARGRPVDEIPPEGQNRRGPDGTGERKR